MAVTIADIRVRLEVYMPFVIPDNSHGPYTEYHFGSLSLVLMY